MTERSFVLTTVAASNKIRAAAASWPGARTVSHAPFARNAVAVIAGAAVPPDLIVLQSSAAFAARDGVALLSALPSAQLLVLLPLAELSRFRAGLPFIPRLGRAWSAPDNLAAGELHQLLSGALETAHQRAKHADVMSRINARLTRTPAPQTVSLPAAAPALSERYFVTLLSTAPDAFFALNSAGNFIALNEAAAALFQAGDMGGDLALAETLGSQATDQLHDVLGRVSAGEIVRLIELPMRRSSDGETRWLEVSLAPVIDEHGTLESMSGTAREITQRKLADAALKSLNENLEAKVEAALAEREIAQSALRQAQKMEAMGQLTGGVAHDFNNLLTPIIGSLDLLQRRGGHSERETRLIDGALQSAERAKTLVQRLLAFARRQPLQTAPVDVAELMSGMADLIASTSGPQIRVKTELPAALPFVLADANQLEMAILNLAVNARDAMPDGGTLTIAADIATGPKNLAGPLAKRRAFRLTVADTGTGMDAETARRAVEPFFSTKGIGKGTGLGLSMVHGLTQQLGGDLTIASRQGFGTRIDLWLPISEIAPLSRADVPDPAPHRAFHGRALVVDDEPLVRLTTVGMLENLGYETAEVDSAMEAQKRLDAGELFDLVVTDHLMPGLTGAELAETIRQTWPRLPVLIISGYAEVDGIAVDLPRLAKPFREAELAEAIKGLI